MLATMMPTHIHQQPPSAHSRPASRASQGSNSPAPSRIKGGKANAKMDGSEMGKKTPRKANSKEDPFQSEDGSNKSCSSKKQATPGMLTLSKPISSVDKETTSKRRQVRGSEKKKEPSTNAKVAQGSSSPTVATVEAQQIDVEGAQPIPKGAKGSRRKKAAARATQPSGASSSCDEGPSVSLLSKSAPASAASTKQQPQDKMEQSETPTSANASGALTWQQQLMAGPPTKPAKKSNGSIRKTDIGSKKASKDKGNVAPENPSTLKDSRTWQQELLGSGKPRGPTYDVFADARDVATFGSTTGALDKVPPKKGRSRADSLGEHSAGLSGTDHKRAGSMGAAVHLGAGGSKSTGQPSTPVKLAYAGPNFHNSPSPASLPMPKFSSRGASKGVGGSTLNTAGDVSFTSSVSSSDEDEGEASSRFTRGHTAPPELTPQRHSSELPTSNSDDMATLDRSVTIESLLAKMMLPHDSS